MKSYLIALVDQFLLKIGLVRARLYRGQEAWSGFLESITAAALAQRCASSEPSKKVRKRAVKG